MPASNPEGMAGKHQYRFRVLGRYPARMKNNQTAVTVSFLAGDPGHLVHSGTLTMTESEWEEFISVVKRALGDDLEVEDHSETLEGASTAEAAKRAWQ